MWHSPERLCDVIVLLEQVRTRRQTTEVTQGASTSQLASRVKVLVSLAPEISASCEPPKNRSSSIIVGQMRDEIYFILTLLWSLSGNLSLAMVAESLETA